MFTANFGSYRFQAATTLALATLLLGNEVRGQVAPDSTVNTQVETDNGVYSITGGVESGTNLFHSFEQFSLTVDEVASFDNGLEIEHIFSRVTGGASEIDGLIQTQGSASLFLLNPAGIVFGGNAQLDIGGSFVASTADSLIFEQGEFSAVSPEVESLLTIGFPIGLQYGRGGEIAVLPNDNRAFDNLGLEVDADNTLALLGGDVLVEQNSLNARGGDVEIASIRDGKVGLKGRDSGWQFDYQNIEQLGRIDFNNLALINSGRVNFRGETISFSAGSRILDFNEFEAADNSINLSATKSISLDDSFLVTQLGERSGSLDEAIADRGGDIAIEAPEVFISSGSVISAGTLSQGGGGNISIKATDAVTIDADGDSNPSFISTSTQNDGLGGSIDIDTGKLTIQDGSQIQAFAGIDAAGEGGTITVDAAREIYLSGKGILRSQNLDENGEIFVSEQELASGFSASSGDANLATDAVGQAQGESGSLTITTPKLTIDRAAQISVNSYGLADAGNIEIAASTLSLDTAGEIVANTASGAGGSINVLAEELIILNGSSSISTTAAGQGNGGNIVLETANLALLDANRLSANAVEGNGGNITVDTQGLFTDSSSSITASSQVETKQGNIDISTLDISSRIATDYRDRSSLIVNDKITSGCGVGADLNASQIRDVGAGGMPSNPFREVITLKTLNDWGDNSLVKQDSISNYVSHLSSDASSQIQPVVEVSNWLINSQGKVELVARDTRPNFDSHCKMNRLQAN